MLHDNDLVSHNKSLKTILIGQIENWYYKSGKLSTQKLEKYWDRKSKSILDSKVSAWILFCLSLLDVLNCQFVVKILMDFNMNPRSIHIQFDVVGLLVGYLKLIALSWW